MPYQSFTGLYFCDNVVSNRETVYPYLLSKTIMLKNTPENGNGLPDSASSNRSRKFWKIYPEDVQHCIDGIWSSIELAGLIGIVAVGGHYCQAGETENYEKEKIEVDAGHTKMSPQPPRHEDFFERDSKFLE